MGKEAIIYVGKLNLVCLICGKGAEYYVRIWYHESDNHVEFYLCEGHYKLFRDILPKLDPETKTVKKFYR